MLKFRPIVKYMITPCTPKSLKKIFLLFFILLDKNDNFIIKGIKANCKKKKQRL